MGHAVLHCEKIGDILPFYQDILGFHLSDYFTKPFSAYFFHVNPRHHSVAFIESARPAFTISWWRPAISTTSARATTSR